MSTVEYARKLSNDECPLFYGWLASLGISKADFAEGTVNPFSLVEEFHGHNFSEEDLGQFALRFTETIEPAPKSELV